MSDEEHDYFEKLSFCACVETTNDVLHYLLWICVAAFAAVVVVVVVVFVQQLVVLLLFLLSSPRSPSIEILEVVR